MAVIQRYAKFKPTTLNPKANDPTFLLVAGVLDVSRFVDANTQVFYCGNVQCNKPIVFERGAKRPNACGKCGSGIDWIGRFAKIVKYCPKCSYTSEVDFYCINDEGVKLEEKEVEM